MWWPLHVKQKILYVNTWKWNIISTLINMLHIIFWSTNVLKGQHWTLSLASFILLVFNLTETVNDWEQLFLPDVNPLDKSCMWFQTLYRLLIYHFVLQYGTGASTAAYPSGKVICFFLLVRLRHVLIAWKCTPCYASLLNCGLVPFPYLYYCTESEC